MSEVVTLLLELKHYCLQKDARQASAGPDPGPDPGPGPAPGPSSLWKTERSERHRAAGLSNSTTFPARSTSTRSQSMMVLSLQTQTVSREDGTVRRSGGGDGDGTTCVRW